MYPSSHNTPIGSSGGRIPAGGNLTRYVSAPGSLISSVVESVLYNSNDQGHGYSNTVGSDSRYNYTDQSISTNASTDQSSCKHESYENEENVGVGTGTEAGLRGPLFRHSSSPAGFFNHLMMDNGFSGNRGGVGNYSPQSSDSRHGIISNVRLKSQLSFTTQDSLSQISEMNESVMDGSSSDDTPGNDGQSYASGGFGMNQWDGNNSTIMFSSPPSSKRVRNSNGNIVVSLDDLDSHSQFGLSRSIEMANVEKLLQMQNDSTPCKIRAKRGFATHPRSIAERERRTRISEKLRKLQELVPNMDKQTSTADMLDLAVQHIKGLQGEVQKLNKDIKNCNCGCKGK